jgi:hypothetical protein
MACCFHFGYLIRLHHQAPRLCPRDRSLVASLTPFYARWHAGNGSSAKIPAHWEEKMRSMLVLLTLLCATKAFAADQYQIIPLYSLAIQGRPQVHGALIINEANGDNYTCSAFVHQEMPISFDSIECSKAVNKVGTMPPGPAALSPFAHQTAAPYPAIWKIDQKKGTLTFCAATEVPAGGWLCGSSKLP